MGLVLFSSPIDRYFLQACCWLEFNKPLWFGPTVYHRPLGLSCVTCFFIVVVIESTYIHYFEFLSTLEPVACDGEVNWIAHLGPRQWWYHQNTSRVVSEGNSGPPWSPIWRWALCLGWRYHWKLGHIAFYLSWSVCLKWELSCVSIESITSRNVKPILCPVK